MPQLVKGGKFVYGMSQVGTEGVIAIPPQAMEEYGFKEGDKVILMSGSRRSGGFGLTKRNIIEKSELAGIVEALTELFNYRTPEAEAVSHKGRFFCWTIIRNGGCISVPSKTLIRYGINAGDLLAVGRGSYLSIAFIVRGPIVDECRKHPELEIFEAKKSPD
jgi:bifunctional DNA-binding transcriptional regulator/antitoxin component of YhaV-PrlF toxin-antitoxin module